jgi:peptide deformylase
MSALVIRRHPDPILREVCAPVARFDAQLVGLAREMLACMYAAPGRGLAGPQVGVLDRLFVMDVTWKDGTPAPVVCINPAIVGASDDTVVIEEGCLSIPDTPCLVRRPAAITLVWQDVTGAAMQADLDGAAARIAQHEIDHLDGILCIDRIVGAA